MGPLVLQFRGRVLETSRSQLSALLDELDEISRAA
jgi:hypothetical protein